MSKLTSEILQSQVKFTNFINYFNYISGDDPPPDLRGAHRRSDRLVPETTDWHTRSLRSREEIDPTLQAILQAVQAADYSHKDQFAIRLALEEALVNAIKHGHHDDPRKEVTLRYRLTADDFLVEIEDQGPGFQPANVPDPLAVENRETPSGRGLLLMRHYMTWVRFNETGNCVALCRRRLSA